MLQKYEHFDLQFNSQGEILAAQTDGVMYHAVFVRKYLNVFLQALILNRCQDCYFDDTLSYRTKACQIRLSIVR